jgi:hypothetical protein
MSRIILDSGDVTNTGRLACHGFWKAGSGKNWRDSGLRDLVPPPAPITGLGQGAGLVGLEVAAEGRAFDPEVVVAVENDAILAVGSVTDA